MADSLLAHIVRKYASTQWENIATDSLQYLLGRPGTEEALFRLLAGTSLTTGPLTWMTQVTNADGSRPDLVGFDAETRPQVVVEVKFWAALTANQPNAYLRAQESAYPGQTSQRLLVFLVPQNRLTTIRSELRRRAEEPLDPTDRHPSNLPDVQVLLTHRIWVLSWAELLSAVHAALIGNSDEAGLRDLAQLEGLCERADAEAMLPITAEEIDPRLAQRQLDFNDLARKARDILVEEKAVAYREKWTSDGGYLRTLSGSDVRLGTYAEYWIERYPTPWWLVFNVDKEFNPPQVHQALKALRSDPRFPCIVGPPEYYQTILAVPPPLGMEADEAARNIADFVKLVCQSLPSTSTGDGETTDETSPTTVDPLDP